MREYLFKNNKFNITAIDFLKSQKFSTQIIQKVKYGGVYVNDKLLSNINAPLKKGDKIKVVLPPDEVNPYVVPIKQKLKIIYEDEYMLAVVKEKGVLTHTSKNNCSTSLEQLIVGYFSPKPFTFRAVNRLDRDTSGIVLIAKDMYSASLLGEQMKMGEIKKTYQAVVVGRPNEKKFLIEKPIKRQDENSMKRICSIDGKYAKSECKLLKTKNGRSLIEIKLHTGRTHQIRVHLSSIGLPLYADGLYGEKVSGQSYRLHAKGLEFMHPFKNKKLKIKSKLKGLL